MSKKNLLLVLETILLVAVSASLGGCGSSRASSPATPSTTAPHRLDTGPLGLPLYCPIYITHDQQGNIYVTDSDQGDKGSHRARIVKLSPTGQLLAEWHVFNTFQSQPTFEGNITGPFGLAVDAQGTIYVADAGDNTIKKLSPTGQLLATWGKTGSAPGELSWPQGVAVDVQGNVYVVDANNSRVQKFSSTGTLLAVFGNTGSSVERLNLPVGIDLDTQGDVYIGDLRNHRLVKFSPTGKVLAIWQRPMDLALFGITVDPQGNIYVVWTPVPNNGVLRGGIRKLSPSGAALANWPATCPPS